MDRAFAGGTFSIVWCDARTGIVLAANGDYQLGVPSLGLVFATFEEAKAEGESIVDRHRYTEAVVLDDVGRERWKASREWTFADLPPTATGYGAPIEWVRRQWRRVTS